MIQPQPPPEPPTTPKSGKKKLSKAEKKLLKLKKAEEDQKTAIRNHLIREIHYTRKSYVRGLEGWEQICKEIKTKELQEELNDWWQRTNRIMDRKNFKLKLLQRDLDTAEEQTERNFSKICQLLKYLEGFYTYSLDTMKNLYESQASVLIQEFFQEMQERELSVGAMQTQTENVLHAANVISENNFKEMRETFNENRFDIVNTEIEARYILRDKTVQTMHELKQQLISVMEAIKQDSMDDQREERFLAMMERQRISVIETRKWNDMERKCNTQFAELQKELVHLETSLGRRCSELRLERNYFIDVYWRFKKSVAINYEKTQTKMRVLARESYETIQKLKELEKYGSLLVSLAACCRKHETQKEKVTPWEDFVAKSDANDNEHRISLDMGKLVHCSEECIMEQITSMEKFGYRVSRVQTHNLILKQELDALTAENEKYKKIVKCIAPDEAGHELVEALRISAEPQDLVDDHLWRAICNSST